MRIPSLILALAMPLLAACMPTHAGRVVNLEIVDRDTGQVLATHPHRGQSWVAGNPGDRYAVRLVNRTGERVLAVLSVDGVNAVTGETAAPDQSGYVLGPWESAEITGWRKSLDDVAQFYFTALPDSYAARTDRPDHVGVIGVAVFREKVRQRPVQPLARLESADAAATRGASAPAAAESASGQAKAQVMQEGERLGTGHGAREYAPTRYTDFQRASRKPEEVVAVRYDSRANLVAAGILRVLRPIATPRPMPRPFPGQFVPDPEG